MNQQEEGLEPGRPLKAVLLYPVAQELGLRKTDSGNNLKEDCKGPGNELDR